MEKPISVGDLVQVVRPGGFCACDLGVIFKVAVIEPAESGFWACVTCGFRANSPLDAGRQHGISGWQPIARLKRIPPLSELEGQRDASGLDVRQPSPADFERMVKKMQEAIK